jgi:ElaB/YqjD/DUF883 family membrane-anchored ribosome-binding protein
MESTSSGSGEVHSHLSSQPDKGEGMSGKFDTPATPGERARAFAGRMRDRTDDFLDAAEERVDHVRGRVAGSARTARERTEGFFDSAEDALDQRSGVLDAARQSPLPALGVAFAVGFLLAGSGDPERHPSVSKTKNQIKGAIMGGISAAVSQQLRSFIEEQGGIGGLLASLGVPLSHGRDDDYAGFEDEPRRA